TWTVNGRSRPSRFVTELRGDPASPAEARRSRGAGERKQPPAGDLDADGVVAFEALRAWRRQRAGADAVPPYVVFHDRTLVEMARRRPQSRADLFTVDGVGPAKLERYGDEVLAVLRAPMRDRSGG